MLDLADHQTLAQQAIRDFWSGRAAAASRQLESGRADQGERAGVTGGKNMNGFLDLITQLVRRNGLAHAQIHLERRLLTLPGYFRPTKMWDVLVMDGGRLIAALELKSQVGPSFGNNFNNRTEEAIGTSHDFWVAYREGALGDQPKPFVGWLMLVEDCDRSRTPVRDASPHFRVFKEFESASYAKRYEVLCRRLVQEQLYTQAALLLSPREAVADGRYSELSETTSLTSFVAGLAAHVAAAAAVAKLA
jgi:hypothetical protein